MSHTAVLAPKWAAEQAIRSNTGLTAGAARLGLTLTSCMMPDGTWQRRLTGKLMGGQLTIRSLMKMGFARRSLTRWLGELEEAGIFVRGSFLVFSKKLGQCKRLVKIVMCSDLHKGQTGPPTPHKERDRRSHYGLDRRSLNVRSGSDPETEQKNRTLSAFVTGGLARARSDVPDLRPSAVNVRDLCHRCCRTGHPADACPTLADAA